MNEFIEQIKNNKEAMAVFEQLQSGKTVAEIQKLKEHELEALYSLAYGRLMAKSYKDAETLFQMLCLYNHLEFKYWLGYAIALKELGKLEDAVQAFSISALMEPEHPVSALQSGICLLKLKRIKEAKEALEVAKALASLDSKNYQTYQHQAESYLASIGIQ